MGVYIPNMEKPKSCNECMNECINIPLECYPDGDIVPDCPLIEIDDKEMKGLINLYKMCKGTSKVKSIQLKDIKPIVF